MHARFTQYPGPKMNAPAQSPIAISHARLGTSLLMILLALLAVVVSSRSQAQDGNYFLGFTYASGANAGSTGSGFYHVDIDWLDHSMPIPTVFEMGFRDSEGNPLGSFGLGDVSLFDGSGMFDEGFNTSGVGQFWGDRFSLIGGNETPDPAQFRPYEAVIEFPDGSTTTYSVSARFTPAVPEPACAAGLSGVLLVLWAATRRRRRREGTRSKPKVETHRAGRVRANQAVISAHISGVYACPTPGYTTLRNSPGLPDTLQAGAAMRSMVRIPSTGEPAS